MQGEISDPRAPLGGNFRPIQPLNGRTMRTNIFVSGKVIFVGNVSKTLECRKLIESIRPDNHLS